MPRWTPKTEQDYRELAQFKGWKWIGTLPKRTCDKTLWLCQCGKECQRSYHRLSNTVKYCPQCYPSRHKQENDYHDLARSKGIYWVGKELPPNSHVKTTWECAEGHIWRATYASVSHCSESGCRECSILYGSDNPNWSGGGGKAGAAHRRRAREANVRSTFTEKHWEFALSYWDNHCAYCGRDIGEDDLTRDHFISLNCGGGYVPANIVPVCLSCNSSKGDRSPLDWLVWKFEERQGQEVYAEVWVFLEIADLPRAQSLVDSAQGICKSPSKMHPAWVAKFDLRNGMHVEMHKATRGA